MIVMIKNTHQSLRESISTQVQQELVDCTECNNCLTVCPVYDSSFSINELNTATQPDSEVPASIQRFTFACLQCGYCVPACPVHLHRDVMIQYLRYKLRLNKPWRYKRYLFIRGKPTSFLKKIMQQCFVWYKKMLYPKHARFMENTPTKAEVLFYPGCYVYSPKTMEKTIALLDHVGETYSVLGGVHHCCGMPHLLQGEFDQAEHCMNQVYQQIQRSNAHTVVTGCLECYQAVQLMFKQKNDPRRILTMVEYLMNHKHAFPTVRLDHPIALLPSCRYKDSSKAQEAAVAAVEQFSTCVHPDPKLNWCCRKWNHDVTHTNKAYHQQLLSAIGDQSKIVACDCLTCYETLNYLPSAVQVIELIDLFYNAIQGEKP